MKKTSINILVLMVLGLGVLSAAAWHFAPPLFGWVIIAAIVGVFVSGMLKYRRLALYLEAQEQDLQSAQKGIDAIPETSILAARRNRLQDLFAARQSVDSRFFAEILSARESVDLGRSAGGMVILLGLAGTFYGLMVAISNAGGSLDSGQTSQTLTAIENIFSSMMGIFGTSFAGLIAALFLNICHGFLATRKMGFMADVEEYTQFVLLPALQSKYERTDEHAAYLSEFKELLQQVRSDLHTQNQNGVAELQKSLLSVAQNLGSAMDAAWQKISSEMQSKLQSNAELSSQILHSNAAQSKELLASTAAQNTQVLSQSVEFNQKVLEQIAVQNQKSWEQSSEQSQQLLSQSTALLQNQWEGWLQAQKSQHQAWQEALVQTSQSAWGNVEQSVATLQQSLAANLENILSNLGQVGQNIASQAQGQVSQATQETLRAVEELTQKVQQLFGQLITGTDQLLGSQSALLDQMEARVSLEQNLTTQLNEGIGEAAVLMRVNQSELQASLEMFQQGIESLLLQLGQNSHESESDQGAAAQIHSVLESFAERTGELLEDNALRSQEIMLEIMEQIRSAKVDK